MSMTTSAAGVTAIRVREGCRLRAYPDTAGIWTIGVGHTGRASGAPVRAGQSCTMAEAELWLASDLKPMELAVNEACGPLTQARFDACVSLAFNIGPGAFRTSSVARHCRAGEWDQAANAFLMWNRAGGHEVEGLLNRRKAERLQFLGEYIVQPVPVAKSAPAVPSPGALAAQPSPTGFWHRFWATFSRNGKVA